MAAPLDLARFLIFLLPPSSGKNAILRVTGVGAAKTAKVGCCLVWKVGQFEIGPGAKIGSFNVLLRVQLFSVGAGAKIGSFNWIASVSPALAPGAPGRFSLGAESAITSRHYFDVSGGFDASDFVTIGGLRTTVLTHTVDLESNMQTLAEASIGERSFVSTNCVLLPGSALPARSVLAAGSVLRESKDQRSGLWAGHPARWKRDLGGEYFERKTGTVSW